MHPSAVLWTHKVHKTLWDIQFSWADCRKNTLHERLWYSGSSPDLVITAVNWDWGNNSHKLRDSPEKRLLLNGTNRKLLTYVVLGRRLNLLHTRGVKTYTAAVIMHPSVCVCVSSCSSPLLPSLQNSKIPMSPHQAGWGGRILRVNLGEQVDVVKTTT